MIEQRINFLQDEIEKVKFVGLQRSLERIKNFLVKNDVEIIDYTNQKFNDGINADIVSIDDGAHGPESIISKTVEPTILCRGRIVKKAKIIITK